MKLYVETENDIELTNYIDKMVLASLVQRRRNSNFTEEIARGKGWPRKVGVIDTR